MADLRLTFSDYYTYVSEFLGLGSSPTGTDLTKCKNIVYRGYRRFLYPIDRRNGQIHHWSFLRKLATIKTVSSQWKYALPKDFGHLIGKIYYDDSDGYGPLTKVNENYILHQRSVCQTTGYPETFAIVPVNYHDSIGSYWDLWLWPEPNSSHILKYIYEIEVQKPEDSTDILVGPPLASEAILESALAIAESQEDDMTTTHHNALADRLIQEMIVADTTNVSGTLGFMRRPYLNMLWRVSDTLDSTVFAADR